MSERTLWVLLLLIVLASAGLAKLLVVGLRPRRRVPPGAEPPSDWDTVNWLKRKSRERAMARRTRRVRRRTARRAKQQAAARRVGRARGRLDRRLAGALDLLRTRPGGKARRARKARKASVERVKQAEARRAQEQKAQPPAPPPPAP
jgi:hypothetical protein